MRSTYSSFLRAPFSLEALVLALMFPLVYGGEWNTILPVSFRVLFAVLSLIIIANLLANRRIKNDIRYYYAGAIYLLFISYCMLSNLWSPGSIYAAEKGRELIGTDVMLFFLCTFAFYRKGASEKVCVAAALLTMLLLFHIFLVLASTPLELDERIGRYQFISATLGLLASILFAAVIFRRDPIPIRLFYGSLFIVTTGVIAMSGGRGGILILLVAMGLFSAVLLRPVKHHLLIFDHKRTVFLLSITSLAGLLVATLLVMDTIPLSLYRLIDPAHEITNELSRSILRTKAIWIWSQNPLFGAGNGGYPVLAGFGDQGGFYPHNLFLELLSEYGLVGFLLFAFLVTVSLKLYFRTVSDLEDMDQLLPLLIFLSALTASMVMDDITSNLLHCGLGAILSPSWRLFAEHMKDKAGQSGVPLPAA